MLTAVGLLLAFAAPPRFTAALVMSPQGQRLQVTANGKVHVLKEWHPEPKHCQGYVSGEAFSAVVSHGLTVNGDKFTLSYSKVVNMRTGDTLSLKTPNAPDGTVLWGEPQGGIALDNGMLLIYARHPPEGMVPPIDACWALVIGERDGKFALVKRVDLSAVTGSPNLMAYRRGNELIVRKGLGAFGAIDLRTFRFKLLHAEDSVMSDSGRIYWQDEGELKTWSWESRKWKTLRSIDPYEWETAYGIGSDDLLISRGAVALARAGKIYRVWPAEPFRSQPLGFYLDRGLGVGLTAGRSDRGSLGVFLSVKNLSVLCRITAKPN